VSKSDLMLFHSVGDHLSSLSGLATSSAPSSPYHTQTESPSATSTTTIQSPSQVALMRNELFKLTSVIAQLTAEKDQARAEAATLRARLNNDVMLDRTVEDRGLTITSDPAPYTAERQALRIENQRLENALTSTTTLEYNNSPTPSRISAKHEPRNDVDRIRGFSFPRGPIPPSSSTTSTKTTPRTGIMKNASSSFTAPARADVPIRTAELAQSDGTVDDNDDDNDDSTAFQLPATHVNDPLYAYGLPPLDYKGYAMQIPSLSTAAFFSMTAHHNKLSSSSSASSTRCIGFENTCGSCRGKVFHL
jgi:regulator of replication initiation timing